MVFRDYFVDFDLKLAGVVSRPTALSLLHIRSELIKRNKEFIVHLCLLRELSIEAYKNEKKTVS